MGEDQGTRFQPDFNGSLRIEGRGDRLTSHAGVVLLREIDEKLGVTSALNASVVDPRDPSRVTHSQSELLRSWVYAMASERTTSIAVSERIDDPALRVASSDRRGVTMFDGDDGRLASQPTRSRLLANLAREGNLAAVQTAVFGSAARAIRAIRAMNNGDRLDECTLDIDSFPHEVHGHQEGSEFNGHYGMRCFHPLGVMVGETAHWLDLTLREGNVHTAESAEDILLPLIDRARSEIANVVHARGDAGFVGPKLLDPLDAAGVRYAFRLRTNKILQEYEEIHARRPQGRPPEATRTWCHDIEYRAETWEKPRRVVIVVQERPGELYLHTFFIVTSFTPEQMCARDVLDLYRARGTMEG
ncbi:MAG: IS1380 family transposase, partial [Planctomycetota bacterium]